MSNPLRETYVQAVVLSARNVLAKVIQLTTKDSPNLPLCIIDKAHIDALTNTVRSFDCYDTTFVTTEQARQTMPATNPYAPPSYKPIPTATPWGVRLEELSQDNASLRFMVTELNKRVDELVRKERKREKQQATRQP
jgi:hypothetical protein